MQSLEKPQKIFVNLKKKKIVKKILTGAFYYKNREWMAKI